MRDDPQRFVTFVLGAFMFAYYGGVGLQIIRVGRKIGRSPVRWGSTVFERLRVIGAFVWPVPVLVWAFDPEPWSRLPHWPWLENWPARLLGLMLLCVAGSIAATAYAELGERWRIGIDPDQRAGFTRSGIYGSIRHPIYAALWLCLLGVFLMAPNILFAGLWAAGATAVTAQADMEDHYLLGLFGKPFRDYTLQTGKFFPLWY